MKHIPVLLTEVLDGLRSLNPINFGLDCTFGRGGHTREILTAFPQSKIKALDRDLDAIEFGKINFQTFVEDGRLQFVHHSFLSFSEIESTERFDFILMDLGVSSPQLDVGARGFSFYEEGPLDMRMDQTQLLTAATLVNESDEEDLRKIFIEYGEVRRPDRVIKAIMLDRKTKPFQTTKDLAEMIARVDGWRQKGKHPATLYFMGLRIAVNDEFGQIENAIPLLVRKLRPGGRLLVITFHSVEDRIVKYLLRGMIDLGTPVNKKVIHPGREEEEKNPRARSAKLRIFERSLD